MNIYEKLSEIQSEMEVKKSLWNDFGKYNYRSAELILDAAKPICKKYKAVLILTDDVTCMNNRFYVVATAKLIDLENPAESINVTGWAREDAEAKGMKESQITGATSSFARKYALNAIFNLDDVKDPDTDEHHRQEESAPKPPAAKSGGQKPPTQSRPQQGPSQGAPQAATGPNRTPAQQAAYNTISQNAKGKGAATGPPQGQQQSFEDAPPVPGSPFEGDLQITFGKYSGSWLSEIFTKQRAYCDFLLSSGKAPKAVLDTLQQWVIEDTNEDEIPF